VVGFIPVVSCLTLEGIKKPDPSETSPINNSQYVFYGFERFGLTSLRSLCWFIPLGHLNFGWLWCELDMMSRTSPHGATITISLTDSFGFRQFQRGKFLERTRIREERILAYDADGSPLIGITSKDGLE
jgi:hypothetical protein